MADHHQQIFLAATASMENNCKQSISLADIDPNIDQFIAHFSAINPIYQHPNLPHLHNQHFPESSGYSENFPAGSSFHHDSSTLLLPPHILSHDHAERERKRKAMDTHNNTSANSSPQVSDNATISKNSVGKGKKVKCKEAKTEDVVHVRAKRGQATDSHSLAERVRREKINERLRCLQDIVPGCYKTMGMAVMLDEIINYVQSLQNQFLSMKLTAASTFYDFNSEADAMETMQREKAFDASKIQNGVPTAQFTPLGFNFENSCAQFPHNRS
ncbi:hypothetical protein C2S51_003284 [Perilla frutescens var. frutescens]|nr:hypothetical protein C2S51_003284 [Perilla frutescens var. frutescens]